MRFFACLALLFFVSACGGGVVERSHPLPKTGNYKLGKPYQIAGHWYYPEFDPSYDERGIASWYGAAFHGKPTANGEVFDRHLISAAHTTLPLPSIVEVTNLENGRKLVLRVNDRGPFVDDRLIDLSEAAAKELGFHGQGLAKVRVRFLELAQDANGRPPEPTLSVASIEPAAPAPVEPICKPNQHFVQVAALQNASRAQTIADDLSLIGPIWRETLTPASGTVHRIRIGPLSDRREAFDILSELRKLGYQEAFVADCQRPQARTS